MPSFDGEDAVWNDAVENSQSQEAQGFLKGTNPHRVAAILQAMFMSFHVSILSVVGSRGCSLQCCALGVTPLQIFAARPWCLVAVLCHAAGGCEPKLADPQREPLGPQLRSLQGTKRGGLIFMQARSVCSWK